MTNFEKILTLSPAETAKLLCFVFCQNIEHDNCAPADCETADASELDCEACTLRWLNGKHNGSGLTEYEKIHSSTVKKFAKDFSLAPCLLMPPDHAACKNNSSLCLMEPFKCAYEWLNSEYTEWW